MSDLTPCTSCGQHVLLSACSCPHCGHTLRVCERHGLATAAGVALLGLGLVGCGKFGPQPDYGTIITIDTEARIDTASPDFDGDGFSVSDGDCDDEDPEIHPDAQETADDGVDSNCDGDDNT